MSSIRFLNIALLFVIVALICNLSQTVAQDDSASPAAKRIALRRPAGKPAKGTTTTTAAPAPAEDEEGDYQDHDQENQYDDAEEEPSSTTTTTTEAPKRIGPIIRPFRSNDDFLNSLRRRQLNAKKNRQEKVTPKPSASAEDSHEAEETAPAAAPAPAKGFKAGSSTYNRRKPLRSNKPEPAEEDASTEDGEHEPKEETKPKRPLGRVPLRKRN